MKIIITNRINNLSTETMDNVEIDLPELLVALWAAPQTQRSKFSALLHKAKPLNTEKANNTLLVLNAYSQLKSIDEKKIYGRRLHSISLKSTLGWDVLEIDETSYLKHRAKNAVFLPNLIKQYSKIKLSPSSQSSRSLPDFMNESPLLSDPPLLRPINEVNTAYPGSLTPPELSDVDIHLASTTPKVKKNLKKIIFVSLVFGIGVAIAFTLFNASLIASLGCAAITSIATFIISKNLPSRVASLAPNISTQEPSENKDLVDPLSKPVNENTSKKMPPKPIIAFNQKTVPSLLRSSSLESLEDSDESGMDHKHNTPRTARSRSQK